MTPSDISDHNKRIADFLHPFLLSVIIADGIALAVGVYCEWWINLIHLAGLGLISVLSLLLLKKGKIQTAGIISLLSFIIAILSSAYTGDGIHDISLIGLPLIIILSSLLFNRFFFILVSLFTLLGLGIINYERIIRNKPEAYGSEHGAEFIIMSLILIITAIVIRRLTVSERQSVDQARQSATRYRNIFRNIQDVYYEHDMNGVFTEITPSVKKFLHYKRKDLIGRNFTTLLSDPGENERLSADLKNTGEITDREIALRNSRGQILWGSISAVVTMNESGSPWLVSGSIRDITEKKNLRDQFLQAQKMEAVGRLAGGVAHDFNNLLTAIQGNSQLLIYELPAGSDLAEMAEEIHKAGERAALLTKQLLTFSRKQIVQPRIINLNTLITNTLKMLERVLEDDIELITHFDPTLRNIRFDQTQMNQIIMNLTVNACDAMLEGGKLFIETRNVMPDDPILEESADLDSKYNYILLSVSDTGTGIDKDVREHIFEPFFTTKDTGKGTGLGLSTVYGIVRQNRGMINCMDRDQGGTTFNVYLPAASETQVLSAESDRCDLPFQGNETILVVEDNDSVRFSVCAMLRKYGYKTLSADSPEKAVDMFHRDSEHIRLMLTDVIMRGMNGKELFETLHAEKPDLKVIYMSGYPANVISKYDVLEKGVRFIQKPIDVDDLLRNIREQLKESEEK